MSGLENEKLNFIHQKVANIISSFTSNPQNETFAKLVSEVNNF